MTEEKLVEALGLFCSAMENATQVLKQELARIEKPKNASGITEEAFNLLKYEVAKGERLGEYEVSYRNHNNVDTWQHCFNILKANNSTIASHYAPEGFSHHYWLYLQKYTDRIFRKKREGEKSENP